MKSFAQFDGYFRTFIKILSHSSFGTFAQFSTNFRTNFHTLLYIVYCRESFFLPDIRCPQRSFDHGDGCRLTNDDGADASRSTINFDVNY
jgi:hypothetical protein